MSIRAFLAIDISTTVREALEHFQDQVGSIRSVKWVSPESMHVTVKFLGDIEAGQVSVLREVLRDVTRETTSFSLTVRGVGGFPSVSRPRILWAGVSGEVKLLGGLVLNVESALSSLGYAQEERPYHPHLTLARIKSRSREAGKVLETSEVFEKEWVFGDMTVDRLCLVQSQLSPYGALYSRLWELPLEKSSH
ncbi:MAG: RNA 2',3'-cyclic phosphodiesterase [Nitrospirales bacterium]|nr:MAG: RNA 2',3'-cyclic phosphodiesterase [Nitrospirales bacterium]